MPATDAMIVIRILHSGDIDAIASSLKETAETAGATVQYGYVTETNVGNSRDVE